MSVSTYALTTVDNIFAWLGEEALRPGIWAYFTRTSGTNTIEIKENSLVLIDVDNGTTTIDLTAAASDTLTEIVDDINDVTGWVSGYLYHPSALGVDLRITGVLNAEGQANEQTLMIKDVYLIEQLIDKATDYIERYCNRLLMSRTFTHEIYYGSGYRDLLLDQYPATRIIRVGEARANSFTIRNSSTDQNYASVEVTATMVRLIVDGGANDDDTSLTLSSYTSIDDLITAITALGKGWLMQTLATDTSTRDASELLQRPSMYVDTVTRADLETIDESLTDYLALRPTSEDRNVGTLRRPGGWSPSIEYFITYVAGFVIVPPALEEACIRLVASRYAETQHPDTSIKKEKLGDYEYEKFSPSDTSTAWSAGLKQEIDLFKKRVL